jgi:hypothetical protein
MTPIEQPLALDSRSIAGVLHRRAEPGAEHVGTHRMPPSTRPTSRRAAN